MPEISPHTPDQRIHDPALAWDMAHAEKPYRELELHARELKLGHVAMDMARGANAASDSVQQALTDTTQESFASDPARLGGNTLTNNLNIRFETYAEAQKAKKGLSDSFIDGAITNDLRVGGERVGIKGYIDKVEASPRDVEIIERPERIAGLYQATTEMLARNLKVAIARNGDPQQAQIRRAEVKQAKDAFIEKLSEEMPQATSEIIDWCAGETRSFPVSAVEYHGFTIDGKDVLNAEGKGSPDVRPNFKIQRQFGGVFVMAYTDKRVHEKMAGKDEVIDKRIYLNPDMEATPQLFEQVLQTANEAGISLQLKMFQRAPEAAGAHMAKSKGKEADGLRGDGVVIYVDGEHADDVLGMVLSIAKDNPDAFKGRKTSRIPQNVADGIAVGDEPVQMPGTSLTSHREKILSYAAEKTRESGKQGAEARTMFRGLVRRTAELNGVNPDNIAFNIS